MTTLDLSIYDHSTFAPSCFAANGVERVIIGTSNYAVSRDMVEGCRAAGIAVEDLYGFIYYGLSWESRDLDNCLRLAGELGGIKRIWLDCESGFSNNGVDDDTEAPGITVQYRMAKTIEQRNRVIAAGLQPGIYTGIYWWRSNMGDSHAFADLPLWIANYGTNDPSNPRPPITEVDFGGWTKPAAHQFSSTIALCGRAVRDHNYWFLESEEEAPMTKSERGLLNIAWGDFERAYDSYVALRNPEDERTASVRGLLPDEGIEYAFANGCADDDLNAAMVMRGRLTTIATSDVVDDAARILGVLP